MGIPIAALLLLSEAYRHALERRALGERMETARATVETAHGLLAHYAELVGQGRLTESEAQRLALAALRSIRPTEDGYFWINDLQPRMIMHPVAPELEGADLTSYSDPDGKRLFAEVVRTARSKRGEGFVEYRWSKPAGGSPVRKRSFVKLFAPWGWIIGSGQYVPDDMGDRGGARLRQAIALTAIATLVLLCAFGFMRRGAAESGSAAQRDGDLGRIGVDDRDERLREIVDNIREVFWVATPDSSRVLYVSPSYEVIWGRSRAALLQHHRDWSDAIHPEDRERILANASRSMRYEHTYRILRPDGTLRWIRDRCFPLCDESGVPQRKAGVAEDVTEQRRAEEALRAQEEEQRSLRQQLIQADRMASIGTLAAGVAHEINNPLAYVMASLEFLARELDEMGAELPAARLDQAREALGDAREGAGRVRDVVRDLKTFSRGNEEQSVRVDVRQVVESSIRMASNEIKHRARLVKQHGPVPCVLGSQARLGQVFLNLILNAAQAIPEGDVDANEIRIVTGTDPSGNAIVEVRDTGTGIPAELLGRIFDPFFTTKPIGVGTGLGLSICRGIVDAAGGEIAVESEVGRGTAFRVKLPPAPPAAREALPAREEAPSRGTRKRVLVVDDEVRVAAAIRRALAPEHDVTVLTSAREARARIAGGERFDVILCDLMMPEMTGMELHGELVALAPDQAERMVVVTGGAFTPRARQFLDTVPNACLEKPFEKAQLRSLVQRLCSGEGNGRGPKQVTAA